VQAKPRAIRRPSFPLELGIEPIIGTLQSEWRTGQDTSPTATWASSGGYAAIAIEVQPAWVAPVQGNPTAAKWNAYVAGDLDFLYRGYGMWLPTPSQSIDGQSKVHGFNLGAFLVPVMCKDAITLNSIAYRSDTANGTIDLGVYQDDGNGTTCSKVATTDLTPMPGGSGAKQITLENPAPLTPWTARKATISGREVAIAQRTDAVVNPTTEITSKRLRPTRSASQPLMGSAIAEAMM